MSDKTAETEKAKKGGKSKARIPITGMTCTNCAATIEKGLSETEGVDSANVNFASEKAMVEFDPNKVDLGKIKDTISELGYGIATKKSIYPVGGMTCASCVARVEEALKTTPGVVSVAVNLASERATVEVLEGTPYADLKKAVEEAGYELGPEILALEDVSQTAQREVRKVRDRLIFAAALTVPLMVLSLIPSLADRQYIRYLMLVMATPVQFWAGWRFYKGLWGALKHRTSDMNTLIAVGTSAAYIYSVVAVFFPGVFTAGGLKGRYLFRYLLGDCHADSARAVPGSPRQGTDLGGHQEAHRPAAEDRHRRPRWLRRRSCPSMKCRLATWFW